MAKTDQKKAPASRAKTARTSLGRVRQQAPTKGRRRATVSGRKFSVGMAAVGAAGGWVMFALLDVLPLLKTLVKKMREQGAPVEILAILLAGTFAVWRYQQRKPWSLMAGATAGMTLRYWMREESAEEGKKGTEGVTSHKKVTADDIKDALAAADDEERQMLLGLLAITDGKQIGIGVSFEGQPLEIAWQREIEAYRGRELAR